MYKYEPASKRGQRCGLRKKETDSHPRNRCKRWCPDGKENFDYVIKHQIIVGRGLYSRCPHLTPRERRESQPVIPDIPETESGKLVFVLNFVQAVGKSWVNFFLRCSHHPLREEGPLLGGSNWRAHAIWKQLDRLAGWAVRLRNHCKC